VKCAKGTFIAYTDGSHPGPNHGYLKNMGVGDSACGLGRNIGNLAVKATRLYRKRIVRITPLADYGRNTFI
jgi:hypothetical protein